MKKYFLLAIMLAGPFAIADQRPTAAIIAHKPSDLMNDLVRLATELQIPADRSTLEPQLAGLLMAGDISGIDLDAPVELFLFFPEVMDEEAEPVVSVRFKVKGDGSAYLASVTEIHPDRKDMGDDLYFFQSEIEGAPGFWLAITNGIAVYSEDQGQMHLAGFRFSPEERAYLKTRQSGISIMINPVLGDSWLTSLDETTAAMYAEDPQSKAIVDWMERYVLGASRQLTAMIAHVDVSTDLTIGLHVQAAKGSVLDQAIRATATPPAIYSSYRDDRALLTAYGSLGAIDILLPHYADMIAGLYEAMGPPVDAYAAEFRDAIAYLKGVYAGGYNLAIRAGPPETPISISGAYQISDIAAARASMDKMLQVQTRMLAIETNVPMFKFEKEEETDSYRGIEIETYRMSFEEGANPQAEIDQAVDAYLGDAAYHIAYMDSMMVFAFGDPADLHRLIDHAVSGEATVAGIPAFAEVPATSIQGYWEMDLSKFSDIAGEKAAELGLQGVSAVIRGITTKEADGLTMKIRLTRGDLQGINALIGALAGSGESGEPDMSDFDLDEYPEYSEEEPQHFIEEEIDWSGYPEEPEETLIEEP